MGNAGVKTAKNFDVSSNIDETVDDSCLSCSPSSVRQNVAVIGCECDKQIQEMRVALEFQLPVAQYDSKSHGADYIGKGGIAEVDKTRYYREWDSIRAALTGEDTRLVRGSFIQSTAKSGGKLPKWQGLPQGAYWTSEELLSSVADSSKTTPRIVSVSYGWLSRDEPDPDNYYLNTLAPLMRLYAKHHQIGMEDLAVFIDWCSIPQRPLSEMTARAHARAMRVIDLWYAHLRTDVWLLTRLPEGTVPFEDRGWTNFEKAAASMIVSSPESLLDLGFASALSETVQVQSWRDVVDRCRVKRRPPMCPDAFREELQSKSFAFQEDRKVVCDKYWGVFHRALGCAERLDFARLEWGDEGAEVLAVALQSCSCLGELDVSDNGFTSAGASAIAEGLSNCAELNLLNLSKNAIDADTVNHLRASWINSGRREDGLVIDRQCQESARPSSKSTAAMSDHSRSSQSVRAGRGPVASMPANSENSKEVLTALLARQAAFEARVEAAMARVVGSVSDRRAT